jgi:hypothetical protein
LRTGQRRDVIVRSVNGKLSFEHMKLQTPRARGNAA